MSEFYCRPLSELAYCRMGETILSKDLDGTGYPIFSADSSTGAWGHKKQISKILKRGSIVIGARGTIGNPRLPDHDEFGCTQTTIAVTPASEVDSYFLKLALESSDIKSITAQQAVPMLTIGQISQLEIPVPPLPEQKKIAEILSGIDCALHQIGLYSTKLDMALKAILYEYPKNFSTAAVRLHDCAFLQAGGTPDRSNPNFWGGNIPWVKTGEVNYNTITRTEETITEAGLLASSARLLPEGSILMAMYGQGITRGRVAKLGIPAATNQACLAINSRIPEINNDFIYNILSSRYDELRGQAQEGTQKNLSKSIIGNQEIPILGGARQAEFCSICAKINDTRALTSKKLRSLQMLKQSLSSDLLSGRKRVTV